MVVDTLGLVLAVTLTAASVQDRDAAATAVGQALQAAHAQLHVQIVRSPVDTGRRLDVPQCSSQLPAAGFVVQVKRWSRARARMN